MAKKTCTYKGKTYTLAFLGDTNFGRRAKLAFLDGSKEFWVDASAVSNIKEGGYTPTARPASRRRQSEDDRCEVCDGNKWTCGHCAGW